MQMQPTVSNKSDARRERQSFPETVLELVGAAQVERRSRRRRPSGAPPHLRECLAPRQRAAVMVTGGTKVAGQLTQSPKEFHLEAQVGAMWSRGPESGRRGQRDAPEEDPVRP